MRKVVLIVAPVLLAYLLMTFFGGGIFGLHGAKLWVFRGALWLIGIVAAAVVMWFFWDKDKKEKSAAAASEEAPSGGEDIAVLLRDAERKLSSAQLAKGAKIGNLPAVLLIGETSSTKTSTMVHSGLEPELLAGQIYQDGNITSTRCANVWYSQQTIFVEAGGKLLGDDRARGYLAKHLQPRQLGAVMGSGAQAPRAALVCVEIERITAGGQAMAATARTLRARLGEIAQAFGIQLPVYVLFTKADRLPFFADFVRNLSNEEAVQPLGVTLPIPGAPSGSVGGRTDRPPGRRFRPDFPRLVQRSPGTAGARKRCREAALHLRIPARIQETARIAAAVSGGSLPAQPVDRGPVLARLLFFRSAAGDRAGGRAGSRGARAGSAEPAD
jgi:type VI secretion system protein ImpL